MRPKQLLMQCQMRLLDSLTLLETNSDRFSIRQGMNAKQRQAVLVNLIELARADGKITAKEEAFIARLTAILDAK